MKLINDCLHIIKKQTGPSPLLQTGSSLHLEGRRAGGQTGFELSHRGAWGARRALKLRGGCSGVCVGCTVVDLGGGGVVAVGGCCAGGSGAGWFGGWACLHHAAGEGQGWLGGMHRHRRTQPLQLPV